MFGNKTEMMGAGAKALEDTVAPKPASEANAPQVALEFSNVQIKFRIVQQNDPATDEFNLFPTLDPSAPSNRYEKPNLYNSKSSFKIGFSGV